MVVWRCNVRPKINPCPAIVEQVGNSFEFRKRHTCEPKKNLDIYAQLNLRAKQEGLANYFESSTKIAERLILEEIEKNPGFHLPNPANLARVIIRVRSAKRPPNPKNLDFELVESAFPPGFFKGEVKVKKQRHFLFASDEQLKLLKTAERWYVDGTFRLADKPFKQLFSIHAFKRKTSKETGEDIIKQVPLMFVIMSRRQASDYKQVFKRIVSILEREVAVKELVSDFERATWRAVQDVFPQVKLFGCAFHWTQAVFRRLKRIGLVPLYNQKSRGSVSMPHDYDFTLASSSKDPRNVLRTQDPVKKFTTITWGYT